MHSKQEAHSGGISDEEAASLWAEFLRDRGPDGLAAFERLYECFLPVVLRFCWSRLRNVHLTEETAQTVFIRLLEGRPVVKSSFIGLILGMARNLCVTELTTKRPTGTVQPTTLRSAAAPADKPATAAPERGMEEQDTRAALADCLDRLPEAERTLVVLHHGEGLTFRQIAEVLGLRVALSSLSRRLQRAKDRLRRCLKEKNIF